MNTSLDTLLNFKALGAIFMYSNTPVYLYTHFRRDASVQFLAVQNETNYLLADLGEVLGHPMQNINDAVKAYALCVSLSFKPNYELANLKNFSCKDLEWFEKVKTLVLEDAPSNQNIAVNLKRTPKIVINRELQPQDTLISNKSVAVLLPE